MNRRQFLAATAAAPAFPVQNAERPNVLVFFTDQQRWDTLGVYGSPMGLTPNLDQFARTGVRFEHAITAQPVCAPARSSLQTGKYPTATGVIHNGLPLKDDEITLGRLFKRAGYQTGYIGKWHLAASGRGPVPLEHRAGYDEWWTASNVLEFTSTPYEGTVWDARNEPIEFRGQYRVDFITDLAVRFLRQRKSGPFFLFISYLEPHFQNSTNTFIAPKGYADRYRNNFWIPPDLAPYPGDWKSQLPEYYGIVARIDECFGRLMEELKTQGALENTLVAFTTDHGCHFRTRNPEYKRSCHEASVHIPMLLNGPGVRGGRVIEDLVSLVDLPATLLDAAGIEPPPMHGRSTRPLLEGNHAGWRQDVLIQMREEALSRALRTDEWKYCVFDPENRNRNDAHSLNYVERYLYDLRADPAEHVNLAGRGGEYRKIADELRERLIARVTAVGEPAPRIAPARYYA